ncbi:hypothetical protein QRX60_15185 [Amycolatopsis mongoliensis]|uniref:Uncharacterized protein n=1 Tax=Amycolatopsis mongoliensis TaxID=715475 RepID=A0A9Y2JXJ0_9PSEU|nr:hypothetical protein [Amycolatopsis sp. 4-36]WIY05112.1 hypothetical protein QRX60_15185 [Amycolatopsis sp. 4-36]
MSEFTWMSPGMPSRLRRAISCTKATAVAFLPVVTAVDALPVSFGEPPILAQFLDVARDDRSVDAHQRFRRVDVHDLIGPDGP